MRTLYVTEQGAVLRRRGELLVVEREGQELARVPLLRLERVMLFGNVQVTTPVLATLLERDIDLVLLAQDGRYRGRVVGAGSRNAELRLRQLEAAREPRSRLLLARGFAEGKLLNQRAVPARRLRAPCGRSTTRAYACSVPRALRACWRWRDMPRASTSRPSGRCWASGSASAVASAGRRRTW